jgi:hypothetical protein
MRTTKRERDTLWPLPAWSHDSLVLLGVVADPSLSIGLATRLTDAGADHFARRLPIDYWPVVDGASDEVPIGYQDAVGRRISQEIGAIASQLERDNERLQIALRDGTARVNGYLDRLHPHTRHALRQQVGKAGGMPVEVWDLAAGPVTRAEDGG